MTSHTYLRLFTAITLTVIFSSGCSVDFGRRASHPTGILPITENSSSLPAAMKKPQTAGRNSSNGDASSERNQGPVAQPVIIRNADSQTGGPSRDGEAFPPIIVAASNSHPRLGAVYPDVTKVSHSEPATPIVEVVQDAPQISVANIPSGMMTLAQFEELALRNNPTIGQASTDINKASALRDQVGRYPNPVLGYFGSQIADAGTDQHGVFVEQEIVRGGKLPINQQIMRHAIEAQTAAAESQALRVLTDVRLNFFVALAAQEQIKLTREFEDLATQGVEVASRRKEAQEGSQPELLQAQIQLSEIQLRRQQAFVAFEGAFRDLAAVTGAPDLQPASLAGDLSQSPQPLDWDQVYTNLLTETPELQNAQARLQQASAQLQRERLQSIANPTIMFGGGVDNATGSGLINVQVGAPIPVFNANQGNVCAAKADYEKATQEIIRIELAIKSRLANVSRDYDSALAAVRKYEDEILPKSQEALTLTEKTYRAGEIDFLQVFLVRKIFFESNLGYIQALLELAQARARIDGLLLEGGLDQVNAMDTDDSNRERVFSQK